MLDTGFTELQVPDHHASANGASAIAKSLKMQKPDFIATYERARRPSDKKLYKDRSQSSEELSR